MKKLGNEKFMLDPWATHEFAMEETKEPVRPKGFRVQVSDPMRMSGSVQVLENWKKEDDLEGLRKKAGIEGNQCLIYNGPCAKDLLPIQVSNQTKNLFVFEAFLRRKMRDEQFALNQEVLHEFSIGEYVEPEIAAPEPETDIYDEELGLSDIFN